MVHHEPSLTCRPASNGALAASCARSIPRNAGVAGHDLATALSTCTRCKQRHRRWSAVCSSPGQEGRAPVAGSPSTGNHPGRWSPANKNNVDSRSCRRPCSQRPRCALDQRRPKPPMDFCLPKPRLIPRELDLVGLAGGEAAVSAGRTALLLPPRAMLFICSRRDMPWRSSASTLDGPFLRKASPSFHMRFSMSCRKFCCGPITDPGRQRRRKPMVSAALKP
mmetsp:Transcript_12139/g.41230  ORF Transcript_12139/g.41230 Transcript_12139/m.41230 type:complete len:222 (-) Transcript_12139:913-1578(-)